MIENETIQETLVADEIVDALDQMIRDGERDFLDEKNLNLVKLSSQHIDFQFIKFRNKYHTLRAI